VPPVSVAIGWFAGIVRLSAVRPPSDLPPMAYFRDLPRSLVRFRSI
jgi:hypothetical protein